MKYVLITALAVFTLNTSAQQKESVEKPEFTVEQIATIKTKRMTLALDLNTSQQQKIQELNLENIKIRKQKRANLKKNRDARTKLTSDERFALKNEALDKAIAHKTTMKNILNKEQFEKWEKTDHGKAMMRKQMNRKKMKHTRKKH